MQLGYPVHQIERMTTISRPHIYRLHKKALERGWNPDVCMKLEESHLANAERTGRPPISTEATAAIVKMVTKNSTTRGYSCKRIAQEVTRLGHPIAPRTVYKILKAEGYACCKLTVKPGLNKEIKKARYDFAKKYENWTLEDWKNVIFSDETAVQLGGVRGRRRVWRKPDEAFDKHVITRRWKRFSEFMFWGCFSYDKKGPYHI